MTPIFDRTAKWSHIRNRNIYIIRKVSTIKHRCLSSFTDSGSNPFSRINGTKSLTNSMQIPGRIPGCQILPVFRFRGRFKEIAMFYCNDIGIEQLRQFLVISGIQGTSSSVAFSYHQCRPVISHMRNDNPLAERSFFGMTMI